MWRDHIRFFVAYTGRARQEGQGRAGARRCEPPAVHVDVRHVSATATGPPEARCPERPARPRPRAQEPARRLRGGQLRDGGGGVPRGVQPHVHDRRPRRRRDRQAEEPQVASGRPRLGQLQHVPSCGPARTGGPQPRPAAAARDARAHASYLAERCVQAPSSAGGRGGLRTPRTGRERSTPSRWPSRGAGTRLTWSQATLPLGVWLPSSRCLGLAPVLRSGVRAPCSV